MVVKTRRETTSLAGMRAKSLAILDSSPLEISARAVLTDGLTPIMLLIAVSHAQGISNRTFEHPLSKFTERQHYEGSGQPKRRHSNSKTCSAS